MQCIYCKNNKDKNCFTNREHVIPQCFGTFYPNNLVLHNCVCNECNQYFGDEIELYMGRDTVEGVFRYQYGIKPRKFPKKHNRIFLKVPEGDLKNILVIPSPSETEGEVDFIPIMQVGFFNERTNEYEYYEPNKIPNKADLKNKGFKKNTEIKLIAADGNELKRLAKILESKGFNIKLITEAQPLSEHKKIKLTVEGNVWIDEIIYRGFCKIAFNYLAYVTGKKFVLNDDFNEIRDFIKYGRGNFKQFFFTNQPPILYQDQLLSSTGLKITDGHIIIVEWHGNEIVSRVSIFNLHTYLIKLCKYYGGIWREIRSGHHFDIHTKEISKLAVIRRRG